MPTNEDCVSNVCEVTAEPTSAKLVAIIKLVDKIIVNCEERIATLREMRLMFLTKLYPDLPWDNDRYGSFPWIATRAKNKFKLEHGQSTKG